MSEPDPMEVEQYSGLWTVHRESYVLARDDDTAQLWIVNITREHPEMKVFTDDAFADAVIRRMQEAGMPVVSWQEMEQIHRRRRGGR